MENIQTNKIILLPLDINSIGLKNFTITPAFIRRSIEVYNQTIQSKETLASNKRTKIFNKDLGSLIDKITKVVEVKKKEVEKESSIEVAVNLFPESKKKETKLLSLVYNRSIESPMVFDYINYHLRKQGINNYTIHCLNPYHGSFFNLIASGIDETTKNNFIFSMSNEFFLLKDKQYEIRFFDKELQDDLFIKKKFSTNFMNTNKGFYIKTLQNFGFHAYLFIFEKHIFSLKSEEQEKLSRDIDEWLKPIAPAINFLIERHSLLHLNMDNHLEISASKLKSYYHLFREKVNVTQILFTNYSSSKQRHSIKKEFLANLGARISKDAWILDFFYNRVYIFSVENIVEKLNEIYNGQYNELQFQISNKVYPDVSNNCYIYF